MTVTHASAIRSTFQPTSEVGPLSPKPGSAIATVWNAGSCGGGALSGPIESLNSIVEPGQPWTRSSGTASARSERACTNATR